MYNYSRHQWLRAAADGSGEFVGARMMFLSLLDIPGPKETVLRPQNLSRSAAVRTKNRREILISNMSNWCKFPLVFPWVSLARRLCNYYVNIMSNSLACSAPRGQTLWIRSSYGFTAQWRFWKGECFCQQTFRVLQESLRLSEPRFDLFLAPRLW